jgi:hypothetical protein
MTHAKELRRRIEDCELQHANFDELFVYLKRRIDDALEGFGSRIEWVVGPSRVGKTMLIRALARNYPERKESGQRSVPVLFVPVPSGISPLLLPTTVLEALGVPLPAKGLTTGAMVGRMNAQLRLASTRVILFEEASHLVDVGTRVLPRAAGDWFKTLSDNLNITMVLTGVPRLERLFESNEQLRLRASARREFRPYDSRSPDEHRAFAASVRTYADLFKDAGWPIELSLGDLVPQCYLLSGGLIGIVSRFMQELATQVAYERPRAITWDDCVLAAAAIQAAGHPDFPAFAKTQVAAVEMTTAHAYVLETNGMAVRRVGLAGGARA